MGQKQSRYTHKVDIRSREVVLQYNIEDPEIAVIWDVFRMYDKNKNGFWALNECFAFIKESRETIAAPILESLYTLGCSGNDGALTFDDFLVAFSSYCAFSSEEVLQFMFITLDKNCTGTVSKQQLEEFYEYKASDSQVCVFPPNDLHALKKFRDGKWDTLNFNEFAFLLQTFPQLAFCGYHAQQLFREGLLGTRFWAKWDAERKEIFMLESRGEKSVLKRELGDGRIVTATKPSSFTMREIQEFTIRRQQLKRSKKVVELFETGADGKRTLTGMKDERLIFCPLISTARNTHSVYHAHVDSEIEQRMHARLLLKADPRRLTRSRSNLGRGLSTITDAPRILLEDDDI